MPRPKAETPRERINISLAPETISQLDTLADGNRSRYLEDHIRRQTMLNQAIDQATEHRQQVWNEAFRAELVTVFGAAVIEQLAPVISASAKEGEGLIEWQGTEMRICYRRQQAASGWKVELRKPSPGWGIPNAQAIREFEIRLWPAKELSPAELLLCAIADAHASRWAAQ